MFDHCIASIGEGFASVSGMLSRAGKLVVLLLRFLVRFF